MLFAKRVFLCAGIVGILMLAPQYFMEAKVGQDFPPAITHPEFFYGFVGVALAFQFIFLTIAQDPVRYRPMMLCGMIEKISFGLAVPILYALGRTNLTILICSMLDLGWMCLFIAAYFATSPVALEKQKSL